MLKSPRLKAIAFTEYGRSVLTKLCNLHFLTLTVCGDNSAFNKRLADAHESRKIAALDELRRLIAPHSTPGFEPEISYTGRNGAEENDEYTEALDQFISESVVTRSVDLYHWYIRRVLQLAIDRDRSLIRGWAAPLDLREKKVAEIESSTSTTNALARIFRGRESAFRKLVHEFLDVPDLGTMPLLVEVRNCIVHHCGDDLEGRVATLIANGSSHGIEVRDGVIHVGQSAAYESVGRAISDISIFDQILGTMFGLPTSNERIPHLHRVYS